MHNPQNTTILEFMAGLECEEHIRTHGMHKTFHCVLITITLPC